MKNKKNLIINLIFICSFFTTIGLLIGFYFFWLYNLIHIGIISITISFLILVISGCIFFSRPKKIGERFFTRFERKKEQKEKNRFFEEDKQEYKQIKKFFKEPDKEGPSIQDLIEYLSQYKEISITEITDHFYPRNVKEKSLVMDNIHWKTKVKSWANYKKMKKVLEILKIEKKINGIIRSIGRKLYYINLENSQIENKNNSIIMDSNNQSDVTSKEYAPNTCPNCGYKLDPDWNTCPKCSIALRKDKNI